VIFPALRNTILRYGVALATLLLLATFAFGQHYQQTNLVSDIPGVAVRTDTNLVNAWGLARSGTSPWWVNSAGASVSILYNGAGEAFPPASPLVVSVPPSGSEPTGIVFNGTTDFEVGIGAPARFIFDTTDGVISGWNPTVDPTNAVIVVDNSDTAAYTGLAISQWEGKNYIYAANFKGNQVEVYDSKFDPVSFGSSAFQDSELPEGFSPFNVQAIGDRIYVAFAKVEEGGDEEVPGPGLGYVDAFTPNGELVLRLKHGRWLNAPWGVALAPAQGFGKFSGELLVGNLGSGEIAVYNPTTGNFHGLLRDVHGKPIEIEGLWALGFGNGANAGPETTLFFAAGIEDETHGLFGTITPVPK
jgi:uncharacterized protein (TIGR03118 family)